MPDWSYHTILRPILWRLPPALSRDMSLGAMGILARSPIGPAIIDFFGHMRPDRRLRRTRLGIEFPAPVGLGAGLDVRSAATPAFERFGFGFLELGPVTARPLRDAGPTTRDVRQATIEIPDPPDNPGAVALAARLCKDGPRRIPVLVRLAVLPGSSPSEAVEQGRGMAELLGPHAAAFTLAMDGSPGGGAGPPPLLGEIVRAVLAVAPSRPILLCLPAGLEAEEAGAWSEAAHAAGCDGLVIDGGGCTEGGRRRMGPEAREPARRLVRRLRELRGDAVLIASGGVHEPIDALELLIAGADLVQVDSGLVFGGPGLPKRINDAVLALECGRGRDPADVGPPRAAKLTWFWALLMGVGMLFGSLLALAIASTRVVMPYDEGFVGLSRHELGAVNAHLLGFMTHDRVTLAGVMTTLGVLYVGLSLFGIRRGLHWAMVTVLTSASVGFGSFFLFLGFGYLDPLHAFVTVVLLQFLVLALHADLTVAEVPDRPDLFNDLAWRLGLWGQSLIIVQASLFLMAGAVIATVGVTQVFVPEDLAYLHTSAEALAAAGPRLVPLIAHDRATLGGMLACAGIGFLLPALWGFRRGARWLWWTLSLAAVPGFAATLIVHLHVGYTDLHHLAPVIAGSGLFLAGLGLSYPYLCARDPATEVAWERLRDPLRLGSPG